MKSGRKKQLKEDVFTAAKRRISYIFDHFDHLYISVSGGKDSAVLLNLAIREAEIRGRLPLDILIVDFEAQFEQTAAFLERIVLTGKVNPYWICLPISLRNSVSQFQPKWVCWDPKEKHRWVRSLPNVKGVISDEQTLPFFEPGVEFEDFVCQFAHWYQQAKGTQIAILIGIRADESLNRYKTIKNIKKAKFNDRAWTTQMLDDVYMAYPIYDWNTEDIWIANGKFKWDYNRVYDLMHQAGVKLSLQRLCQPFGDEQRKSLWLYQKLEPDTWQKLVERVEGCNFGARYTKDQGRILGYYRFTLPDGLTYRQYSKLLLKTMPPELELHYRQRIFKFLQWWRKNGPPRGVHRIPDFADSKLETKKKVPSWRRICRVLIKNDYWCRGLSFGYNQSSARTLQHLTKPFKEGKSPDG
ncbi:DUF3440 domain-containing protein [Vibrio aquaticus]|uniref:DUF3440 domain-containing protein n=1 Tax=Vibrio aquaticus TaxID=2496559 RepID=A0A3S0Q3P4_9VIBR|nr:DUF3440 domain-containing protein [Vibrio aquaticus]RTZ17895.1 DUF3440 domain-containing protein [Vibrio aquaticus]